MLKLRKNASQSKIRQYYKEKEKRRKARREQKAKAERLRQQEEVRRGNTIQPKLPQAQWLAIQERENYCRTVNYVHTTMLEDQCAPKPEDLCAGHARTNFNFVRYSATASQDIPSAVRMAENYVHVLHERPYVSNSYCHGETRWPQRLGGNSLYPPPMDYGLDDLLIFSDSEVEADDEAEEEQSKKEHKKVISSEDQTDEEQLDFFDGFDDENVAPRFAQNIKDHRANEQNAGTAADKSAANEDANSDEESTKKGNFSFFDYKKPHAFSSTAKRGKSEILKTERNYIETDAYGLVSNDPEAFYVRAFADTKPAHNFISTIKSFSRAPSMYVTDDMTLGSSPDSSAFEDEEAQVSSQKKASETYGSRNGSQYDCYTSDENESNQEESEIGETSRGAGNSKDNLVPGSKASASSRGKSRYTRMLMTCGHNSIFKKNTLLFHHNEKRANLKKNSGWMSVKAAKVTNERKMPKLPANLVPLYGELFKYASRALRANQHALGRDFVYNEAKRVALHAVGVARRIFNSMERRFIHSTDDSANAPKHGVDGIIGKKFNMRKLLEVAHLSGAVSSSVLRRVERTLLQS